MSHHSRGTPAPSTGERILIVALTHQRNDDLGALLPMLLAQAQSIRDAHASVLVVDNDPAGGARCLVEAHGEPDTIEYLHVPSPGIAAARNAALAAAASTDLLVFIDDDERPVEQWLQHLVRVWRQTGSAAVVGPVVSEFADELDPWIVAGRFFDRRRMPTGTAVDTAATNNLLLDMEQVRSLRLAFDERFGLSGGSDTLFTRQLHDRGGVMTWCDEAIVIDVVPSARLTRSWVMRRAFRSGNTWMRTSLVLAPTPLHSGFARIWLGIRGAVRVLGGAFRVVAGMVTKRMDLRARGARTVARGAGILAGSVGSTYVEYRRA
ncbi:glycosyltransferase [Marisediminicola senii]|uniref:glycosyltransferase n=1 Tax=Marisediminicola senii TaxID=2711233 RepID=UPI001F43067C|nr:glycosyltransferase [Marisediminicola senii]